MNIIKFLTLTFLLVTSLWSLDLNLKDVSKYQQDVDVFKQLDFAKNMYQGNEFITKDEFNILSQQIKDIQKEIGTGPYNFLIYLTSSSVPTQTMMNVLYSLSILQDNGIKIYSKQYIMGPPRDFKDYMYTLNSDLENKFPSIVDQEKVKRNFGLKIDPRYFDYFKLKEAPALVTATCPGLTPDINKCKFHHLMRGDVGLVKFFDKISREDKNYEKLVKILIANKIVDKEGN